MLNNKLKEKVLIFSQGAARKSPDEIYEFIIDVVRRERAYSMQKAYRRYRRIQGTKIRKTLSIPAYKTRPYKYPFPKMKVKDYFIINNYSKKINCIGSAIKTFKDNHQPNWGFVRRKVGNRLMVIRTK